MHETRAEKIRRIWDKYRRAVGAWNFKERPLVHLPVDPDWRYPPPITTDAVPHKREKLTYEAKGPFSRWHRGYEQFEVRIECEGVVVERERWEVKTQNRAMITAATPTAGK